MSEKKIRGKLNTRSLVALMSKLIYKAILPIVKPFLLIVGIWPRSHFLFLSSPDFSDNGRVLSDYLKNNGDIQLVWAVAQPSDFDQFENEKIKFIKIKGKHHSYPTVRYLYYAMTSRIIFYTHDYPKFPIGKWTKKPQLINLWHGSGYKDSIYKDAQRKSLKYQFDYVLVPGKVFVESKARFFGCSPERILDIGYPRYDLFFSKSTEAEAYVVKLKTARSANKCIVWMPTFRTSDYKMPEIKISAPLDLPILSSLQKIREFDEYLRLHRVVLIIKIHKNERGYALAENEFSNVFFMSNSHLLDTGIQLYELLPYTDSLLTDYSSVGIDYLLLDKPIGFTLDDIEEYRKKRGFIFDDPLQYMPGNHIYDLLDLKNYTYDVVTGKDKYKITRDRVRSICHNETACYSRRIVEMIIKE